MFKRIVVAATLLGTAWGLGLLGPASAQSRQAEERMTTEAAAEYFLDIRCKQSAAIYRFNESVFRGRNFIRRPEVQRRLPELRRYAGRLGEATYAFARRLVNPPKPWPRNAAPPISELATGQLELSRKRRVQLETKRASNWIRLQGSANELNGELPYSRVNKRLELPHTINC